MPHFARHPESRRVRRDRLFQRQTVATSYPVILSRFFKGNGINAEIHEIAGSVGDRPSVGMADAIFDIVSPAARW